MLFLIQLEQQLLVFGSTYWGDITVVEVLLLLLTESIYWSPQRQATEIHLPW